MPIEVVMPQMGYDMAEGTLVRWLKHENDSVTANEVIAEIETDKAVVEMQAPDDGTVLALLISEGMTVPVGSTIAYIGVPGEVLPAEVEQPGHEEIQATPPGHQPGGLPQGLVTTSQGQGRTRSSPLARKLAIELGIEISQVPGTGPNGRVTVNDVTGFNERSTIEIPTVPDHPRTRKPGPDGKIALGRMGRAIARRTEATVATTPLFYVTLQIDMEEAIAFRERVNGNSSTVVRVTLNDLILKACAIALERYPVFNATFEDDHLKVRSTVDIGVAIALDDGLIVPAIMSCDRKSVLEIAAATKDLAQRARNGTLRQEEYNGSFSVSNLGMYGVDSFTAIVVSPQVGILAVGACHPRPAVRAGVVVAREAMLLTLSADHRAVTGQEAAQFVGEIKRILETLEGFDPQRDA